MKLGNYINQLLPEHDMVIVPGFGAFSTINKPAQIDDDGENILPPSKEIIFNAQIRNNDGLLVGHVAQHENVSHFDALHIIEKEREDILYRLDKGEKVELEKTGTFLYNESHEIRFEAFPREDLSPESFGLAATSLSEPEFTPEQETTENTAEPESSVVFEEPAPMEEEPEFEPVENIDPELKEAEEEKRKKSGWIWFLLILIPLAGAGIYIMMNGKDSANEKLPPESVEQINENIPESQEQAVVIDSLQNDSTSGITQDSFQSQEIAETGSNGPNFYLIAGSFKEEENVEKYMQELRADGYEPFPLGKKGNFYLVGINTFSTERQALAAQDSFLARKPDSGAWVYEE